MEGRPVRGRSSTYLTPAASAAGGSLACVTTGSRRTLATVSAPSGGGVHRTGNLAGAWAPTKPTAPRPFLPVKLRLTGSSFPADSAKPVPLAVVSLDSR